MDHCEGWRASRSSEDARRRAEPAHIGTGLKFERISGSKGVGGKGKVASRFANVSLLYMVPSEMGQVTYYLR